ncbi:MAG: hypothetical protein Q8M07_17425, partial [Prosthecobacter sp.]|nr:hypothetical protein [Prosthecobacter sp.]
GDHPLGEMKGRDGDRGPMSSPRGKDRGREQAGRPPGGRPQHGGPQSRGPGPQNFAQRGFSGPPRGDEQRRGPPMMGQGHERRYEGRMPEPQRFSGPRPEDRRDQPRGPRPPFGPPNHRHGPPQHGEEHGREGPQPERDRRGV